MIPACWSIASVLLIFPIQTSRGAQRYAAHGTNQSQGEADHSTSHYVAVAQLNQSNGLSAVGRTDHVEQADDVTVTGIRTPITPMHHANSNADVPASTRDSETQSSSPSPLRIGRPTFDDQTGSGVLNDTAPASFGEDPSFPLKPPTKHSDLEGLASKLPFGIPTDKLITMGSSLAIVLGLFFLLMLFTRRNGNKPIPNLSKDVFEILGRTTFVGKQQLYLVRLGNKLTLWSVSAGVTKSLVEVDDPQEVDRIAGLCQKGRPGSISATFQEIMTQMNGDTTRKRSILG